MSLHNSGGELFLYTIQGENCVSQQFGCSSCRSTRGYNCLSIQFRGGIVSLHNSGGELCIKNLGSRRSSVSRHVLINFVN